MSIRNTLSAILAAAAFLPLALSAAHAADFKAKLPLSRISTITVRGKNVTCALFRGRTNWVVARRVKGSVYKKVRGTSAQRTACRNLSAGELGTVTLNSLPSTDGLVATNNDATGGPDGALTVSGTPPVLPEIPNQSIKTLFWRPGVIDAINSGSPTSEQCGELFESTADGQSSGFGGCYMTQNVGFSFETVLRSGTTLCYMRNAFTQETLNGGAASLLNGSFPNNDISQLFAAPSGSSSRVVRIDANGGGDTSFIYIRVYGTSSNSQNGDTYRFDYWSCNGNNEVDEFETTRVRTNGQYVSTSSNTGEHGNGTSTVSGFLRRDGDRLVFDATRNRSADTASSSDSGSFKSSLLIDGNNVIRSRDYAIFSDQTRKAYTISRITGSSIADLQFLEGSYKETFTFDGSNERNTLTGVEFRDTYYAAAPANAYLPEATSVNFAGDSFYSTVDPVTYDPSDYSCSATPNVRISLDLGHPLMADTISTCEGVRLDGMSFCEDAEVQNAFMNYLEHCQAF